MSKGELIVSIIVFMIAIALIFLAIFHFGERGYLFNNAYIYASKTQRETMNKKPYYRQSAVVFCLLSIIFIIIGLAVVLQNSILFFLEIPFFIIVIVYAIISTLKINKQNEVN
ncbi:DUF3784 domain-containing protein [Butyrivibrio sp. INlla16]|uniref:DUF3784 domain-containing protein n=1 Tax=Butyrivibrio sp. INlla16 TaxID=1520807 RepID=UPI00088DAC82|nr:DUF3784 domain-containing protein [Butyrivibrio sp. INlla16]SDB65092.1 protein of unknown function [Butyrivibrio sp. INlla16]